MLVAFSLGVRVVAVSVFFTEKDGWKAEPGRQARSSLTAPPAAGAGHDFALRRIGQKVGKGYFESFRNALQRGKRRHDPIRLNLDSMLFEQPARSASACWRIPLARRAWRRRAPNSSGGACFTIAAVIRRAL